MKIKHFSILLTLLLTSCTIDINNLISSITGPFSSNIFPQQPTIATSDRLATEEEIITDFKSENNNLFKKSTWANHYPFNCRWSADNIKISNGTMKMSLIKKEDTYYGSEYSSRNTFSYGFFATKMKPISCPGVVSSFFTYTNNPVWDEIDIEFLGKDTTKVQFNYYTNGIGNHEYLYDLGFDASKEYHEYAFEWKEDCIIWFVDGKAVYKATDNIPSNPRNIMMNVWNVHDDYAYWAGKFNEKNLPVTAEYKFIAYGKNA